MSHFRVVVALPPTADADALARALLPYHEFECTGIEAFVVDVDRLPELRDHYASATRDMVRLADGEVISCVDPRCYRDPTPEDEEAFAAQGGLPAGTGVGGGRSWHSQDWGDGRGYRTKFWALPEGATEIEQPIASAMSFVDYVRAEMGEDREVPVGGTVDIGVGDEAGPHKYGWWQRDESGEVVKAIRRTNPNAKWDWYVVGGRFKGVFSGLVGALRGGDIILAGNIDLDIMARAAATLRMAAWDEAEAEFNTKLARAVEQGRPIPPGCEDYATARNTFHDWWSARVKEYEEAVKAAEDAGENPTHEKLPRAILERGEEPGIDTLWKCMPFHGPDKVFRSREHAGTPAEPFWLNAYVDLDGVWHERGRGGWWGVVADERPRSEWTEEVVAWIKALPPDAILVNVDYHI